MSVKFGNCLISPGFAPAPNPENLDKHNKPKNNVNTRNTDRIVLCPGKQTELVKKAKEAKGYSWPKLAKELGISPNYLKNELLKERRTLKADIFLKLGELSNSDFIEHITEVRNRNWGRSKGGKLSKHHPRMQRLLATETSADLAEFLGAMLGDGGIYVRTKGSHYQARITGHLEHDNEYVSKYLPGLMERIFGIKPNVYEKKSSGTIVLSKQSKDLCHTLEHFGLEPGNKLNYLNAPEWIFEKHGYMRRFLRGLIDTDGSICPKTKKHKTPAIWFSSASPGIRDATDKAFKSLGYRVSVWTKRNGQKCMQCSIGNSEDVLKYYKEIGFGNPKHEIRFRKFWKAPIV